MIIQMLKTVAFFIARKNIIRSKILVNSENKHVFGVNYTEDFIKDKRIISISPGGFKGFYMLGICKYIKENYNLENYIFSGASAGAWNSLLLCYKGDINAIIEKILDDSLQKTKSISELEDIFKKKIVSTYNTNDFDLRRLFVGVTTVSRYNSNTIIYSGFDNLEDAINCCIASSHIPLITGGLTNVYRNTYSFDGGFSKFPYLNVTTPDIHITPNIWKVFKNGHSPSITDYTTLFSKNDYKFSELIEKGYNDAMKNKEYLDNVLK
jgi:hypothetical protein